MPWRQDLLNLRSVEGAADEGARENIMIGFLRESVYPILQATHNSLVEGGYDIEVTPSSEDSLQIGDDGGAMLAVRAGLRPLEHGPVAFRVIPQGLEVLSIRLDKPFGVTESHAVAMDFSAMEKAMWLLNEFVVENKLIEKSRFALEMERLRHL